MFCPQQAYLPGDDSDFSDNMIGVSVCFGLGEDSMKKVLLISLVAMAASSAFAAPFYTSGALTANSPTFDAPGASGLGTAVQYYSVLQFQVTSAGAYTIEMSSLNTSTSGVSNALDTFMVLYTGSFNPAAPAGQTAFNDDFSGSLTVLPGPYSGIGYTNTATGFSGLQPSSRFGAQALVTGVDYFLVSTSFRSTDYVNTTDGAALGSYVIGINGPGDVQAVPEPATMVVLGAAALAAAARKRRK